MELHWLWKESELGYILGNCRIYFGILLMIESRHDQIPKPSESCGSIWKYALFPNGGNL